MALSKNARGKLQKLVQQSKRLLFNDISSQLQQFYGIFPETGKVLMVEELPTSDVPGLYTAKLLRQRLAYLRSNLADDSKADLECIDQLIREQAFSILNRLAALRMAEERRFIRESIRNGYTSEGFQVYDSITGQGATAETFIRYKWYLYAVFDELALDLPAVFDRYSPYALVFPTEQALMEVLACINSNDVSAHREEGQPVINLWQDDETIGWIYQYYNSREEIKAMRDASDAPRNSRELAVRNQFFTPRYVVQFLTDNSLGRIWYEMTRGNTELKSRCPYMIIRPNEVFLDQGDAKPASENDETTYIDHRPIKDPREIRMLDPACGSMHFGLYAFDLFEIIYLEAWDKYPDLLTDLKNIMTRASFIKQIPVLIIRHNIHGVDIDPRALQIAALSLWLRAQRSFEKLNLQPSDRPQITKSNLVLAEPMPGDAALLQQVVEPLDKPMRELVLHIWGLMKMAGETGLLLRIEKEIDTKIQSIVEQLKHDNAAAQLELGDNEAKQQVAEEAARYASKQYREDFLNRAEAQVLDILKRLAHEAHNGNAYQKLLFADDSARGFAFIELCRLQYDVVLMNPPFGSASVNTESYFQNSYPNWGKNILAAFFSRMLEMISNTGLIGAIYDRTVAIKSSYEGFRKECLCGHITAMADTGWNVLEANVETTTTIFKKSKDDYKGFFIDLLGEEQKETALYEDLKHYRLNILSLRIFIKPSIIFEKLPNSVIGYSWPKFIIDQFDNFETLIKANLQARDGHNLASFEHFRVYWEIYKYAHFELMYNGGEYSLFYQTYRDITLYGQDGYKVKANSRTGFRNLDYQKKLGVGYGKRGEIFDAHVLKEGCIFTKEGQAINNISKIESLKLLSFLNSIVAQYNLSLYAGQHKASGYVNLLPIPFVTFQPKIIEEIIAIKRIQYSIDETTLEFRHLLSLFSNHNSIKDQLLVLQSEIDNAKSKYIELVDINDKFWLNAANIPIESWPLYEEFKNKRPNENLTSIDGITDNTVCNNPVIAYEIISNLLGVAYGRWDIRSIKDPSLIPEFGDFFDPLPFMPVVALMEKPKDYPIDFPEDGILIQDADHARSIRKAIEKVIVEIWGMASSNILNELTELGKFTDLQDFLARPSGFFDFHYTRYTKSRREAPIYWPLSSSSGTYTVWLYYPKLNDQTLFKVVNDFVKPKIESVAGDLRRLHNNPSLDNKGLKELRDNQDLLHELQDFEKELLALANLPYKPNQDDGVLITAAPLYKFFRHNKWRSSTEACWKSLQKGDYDWAHLAYSIWPDRVRKKCIKDLSLAIAHGLEDICEVKPREKKEKKATMPKEIKKKNQLSIEE